MSKRLDSTPLNAQELDILLEICRISHDHLMKMKHEAVQGAWQAPGASALYGDYARHCNRLILRLKLIRKDCES